MLNLRHSSLCICVGQLAYRASHFTWGSLVWACTRNILHDNFVIFTSVSNIKCTNLCKIAGLYLTAKKVMAINMAIMTGNLNRPVCMDLSALCQCSKCATCYQFQLKL